MSTSHGRARPSRSARASCAGGRAEAGQWPGGQGCLSTSVLRSSLLACREERGRVPVRSVGCPARAWRCRASGRCGACRRMPPGDARGGWFADLNVVQTACCVLRRCGLLRVRTAVKCGAEGVSGSPGRPPERCPPRRVPGLGTAGSGPGAGAPGHRPPVLPPGRRRVPRAPPALQQSSRPTARSAGPRAGSPRAPSGRRCATGSTPRRG